MATTKAAAKTGNRGTAAVDPRTSTPTGETAAPSADASATTTEPAPKKTKRAEELVSMAVHHAFNLTLDDGNIKRYEVGIQDMPKSHSEHWYTRAHADAVDE